MPATPTNPRRAIRALLLSDGRPGHYHLAEGVLAALARRQPVQIERLALRRRRWLPGRVLAATAQTGVPAARMLALGFGLDADHLPPSDLVVSAGGETLVARHLGSTNIYCGTLKRLPPEYFSLIVSSYQRHAGLPRHLVALKPNGIDPDTLGLDRPRLQAGRPPRLAGLLVGGDSGLFHYAPEEWLRLGAFLGETHRSHGTRWIVSTSRRTDAATADAFAALAAAALGPVARLIDFRAAGPGTLPGLFAGVEAILATADSSSMLSEAVCARLPVVGVHPRRHAFKDDEGAYRAMLLAEDWCRFLPLDQLTPASFVGALAVVRPMRDNHLDRLAASLVARLPQLGR